MVLYGAGLTDEEAIARRRAASDIVVRGNVKTNKAKAREIEAAVGPCELDQPHARAGKKAMPHFHQQSRLPDGHTFYEDRGHRARRIK
jgi:hypothetical protein